MVLLQDLFKDQREQFTGFTLPFIDPYQLPLFIDTYQNGRRESDDKNCDRFYANAFVKRGLSTEESSLTA